MNQAEVMIRVSLLYHKRRERFFRILDACAKFLSIVALTALAASDSWIGIAIAIISGAATILSIVLDFPAMATKHEGLARDYLDLLSKLTGEQITEQEADASRRDLGAREPSVLRGLAQICTDEIEASIGCDVEMSRLSNWRRFKAHFGFGEMQAPWAQHSTDTKA